MKNNCPICSKKLELENLCVECGYTNIPFQEEERIPKIIKDLILGEWHLSIHINDKYILFPKGDSINYTWTIAPASLFLNENGNIKDEISYDKDNFKNAYSTFILLSYPEKIEEIINQI